MLLGADKQNFAAFADGVGKKAARGFQLVKRLAQVNDVNTIAGIEDERLHLGVPPFGLVSEMDARIEQFLNSNTNHNFPLVKSPAANGEQRTIPRNTGLILILLWPPAPVGAGN